ncbi:VOC family protein [Streptomyces rimosus]|uniref:VOC family protein n=1 Tax=Streptomyces rimosus TaxID=1927 RepID=UPI0004C5738B|nr:VOC family protein [Streptomyces rimosus]
MTTEATTRRTPGAPCWVSLMVHDLAATEQFYGALFGWEFKPGPQHFGPYVRAYLQGREVAGIGELAPERQLRVAWTTYLASDDADAAAEQIRGCGGTVAVGPLDADDEAGRMAIASDPEGAVFGLWQGKEMVGAALVGVPGTPVWNELVTRGTDVAAFYRAVFGYETHLEPAAGDDYLTLHLKDRPVAGVHGAGDALPREPGPHWVTYFATADTDAAVRRVVELGGQEVRAARDTPYGRVAMVADPEGAEFALLQQNE